MTAQLDILTSVRDYLSGEIECGPVSEADGRVACLTPLDYPSGDGVVIWTAPQGARYEITDYGEAYLALADHKPQSRNFYNDTARRICNDSGVEFVDGRITTHVAAPGIADAVWRVASASAQLAGIVEYHQPKHRNREREFAKEIQRSLTTRNVPVIKDERLIGQSGHSHRATLFLPGSHTIIEPISTGHWNQVSTTYAKLGDLSRANGYSLFSVIDDRQDKIEDDIVNMLVQVSDVVEWSHHEEWLAGVN